MFASAGGFPGRVEGNPVQPQVQNTPLSEFPDSLGRYVALIIQYNLRDATVTAPNIRDGTGVIIRLHEYSTKLRTGGVVFLECLLGL